VRLPQIFRSRRLREAEAPVTVTRLVVRGLDPVDPAVVPAPDRPEAAVEPGRVLRAVPSPRPGDAAAAPAAVRAWAREQGLEVGDRGRLPTRVLEAYRAAH
jgi:hypothetical protein